MTTDKTTARYLASPKGRAMAARKAKRQQATRKAARAALAATRPASDSKAKKSKAQQEKRKAGTAALAKIKRRYTDRTGLDDAIGKATFSSLYTVHNVGEKKHLHSPVRLGLKRRANDKPSEPKCVQGGLTRWSESIHNPSYNKHLETLGNAPAMDTPTPDTTSPVARATSETIREEREAEREAKREAERLANETYKEQMERRKFSEARTRVRVIQ